MVSLIALLLAASGASIQRANAKLNGATKNLRILLIDVEGGAASLFVTPEGESLLIDTGWPNGIGPLPRRGVPASSGNPSSAERIADAAQSMGIKKVDYLLMTHYHVDHLGGLQDLLAKLPVGTFIDHGPNREEPPSNATPRQLTFATATLYPKWEAALHGHRHITAQVGKTLDIDGMHLTFVTSDGKALSLPLPGAGQQNASCAGVLSMDRNGGEENVRSVGTLIRFGKTRILDLGDLTWNKELELLCPVNKIGKVDVLFITGHGMDLSTSPPTAAFDPLIALMQNGSTKGGDDRVIQAVNAYPHLEGFWRAHDSARSPNLNGDPNYIANLGSASDDGHPILLDVAPDGSITVTNGRNQFKKAYKARGGSGLQ